MSDKKSNDDNESTAHDEKNINSSPIPVKRFIAGAVCPKCALMDKLVMYRTDNGEFRECVSCGFSDQLIFQPQARELETRVNVTEAEKKAQVQVLNFLPASAPKVSDQLFPNKKDR